MTPYQFEKIIELLELIVLAIEKNIPVPVEKVVTFGEPPKIQENVEEKQKRGRKHKI